MAEESSPIPLVDVEAWVEGASHHYGDGSNDCLKTVNALRGRIAHYRGIEEDNGRAWRSAAQLRIHVEE